MEEEQVKTCIEALLATLSAEYTSSDYSFNGYKEDAVCLQQDNENWMVYVGYRNKKDDLKTFSNIVEACLEMIKVITGGNSNKIKRLNDSFLSKIVMTKRMANLSYEDKMNIIAAEFKKRIQRLESLPADEAKKEAHEDLVKIGFIDNEGNLTAPYIALRNQNI